MGHLDEFSRWPARRFIETGFGGGKTLTAAALAYPECVSIEFHYGRYLAAVAQFGNQPHVRIFHGNSPDVLQHVIDPQVPTVFWLDAHFVPGDTDILNHTIEPPANMCPLIEELDLIKSREWSVKPVILIDDWSTFRTENHGWPKLKALDEFMGSTHFRLPELPGCDVFGYA